MNDQTFKPESKLIRQLFADDNAWYNIPEFQRPYRWEGEQISQLWEDLMAAFKEHKDNPERIYFLGAMIMSAPPNEGDIHFDVIDGQQRLTALITLFSVVRDHYPKINETSKSKKAIKIKDLYRAIDNDNPENESRMIIDTRLIPYPGAITCFSDFVSRRGVTCEKQDSPTKDQLKSDDPKYNYILTVQFFKEELSNLSITEISDFINFVFNYVKVIKIECTKIDFAMELFQVINTRGMDLRPSDLIKSFLLIKIQFMNKKKPNNKYEHFIKEWRKIEEDAQESESNMDEMLILYSYYELVDSPGKDFYLYNNLKKHFEKGQPEPSEIVVNIKRFVENYKIHIEGSNDVTIYALSYLPWKNLWKSILLSLMQEKYHKEFKNYQRLTKQILRFYYLHWIAGNTMSKVKKVSFDVIESIKRKESINKIEKKLNDNLLKHDIVKKALECLNSSKMGEESWCKPLLLSIDYILKDEGPFAFIRNDAKSQLEHILPRGFEKNTGWQHISDDIAEIYLNSLGNLTLLSGPKNREASNKPFDKKIEHYRGRVGSQINTSRFQLTQDIIDKYNEGAKNWDEFAIKKRREYILEKAAELLGIQEEMVQFLKENKKPKKTD